MAFTPLSMVVSIAFLNYVMMIFLDLIKVYDLVNRYQVMANVDE